jgi:Fur family peroxide stress response transcriptional regulator
LEDVVKNTELIDKYRNMGLKLTPQRLAILNYLDGNKQHPSAEDIYNAVKERFPTMSFATVYNTLEALRKRGLIRELAIDGERKRYDPNIEPHHHILCIRCRKVADMYMEFDVPVPEEVRQKFVIFGNHIEFYGLCEDCRRASHGEE